MATNIFRSYLRPRATTRAILDQGQREDRAIAYLMAACVLIFVAQWPLASRQAHLDPTVPLQARLGGALLAWIFIMPLVFYGLAALSHLIARAFGGQGDWFSARIALFWTLLVVSPLLLLQGLTAGLVGPGPALIAVNILVTVAFIGHWLAALLEAERVPAAA